MTKTPPPTDLRAKVRLAELANIGRKLKAGKTLNARESALIDAENDQRTGASARRPKTKLDTADTLPAAASRLGVDASLLRSLRASGSLAFKNGRVDLAMIRAELASMPAPKAGAGDAAADLEDKQTLERRKLKAQFQREEFRLAVARRDYLLAADVAADMVRIANATRAECLRLLADAPTWEGLTAAEISARATAWMTSVCVNLSDETSKLYR